MFIFSSFSQLRFGASLGEAKMQLVYERAAIAQNER
jgi:hypothetical protein